MTQERYSKVNDKMDLNGVWDWNVLTGDPYIPPEGSPHSRFCATPAQMNEVAWRRFDGSTEDDKRRLFDFMTSNEIRLTTRFDTSANSNVLASFLRLLRALDLKKIRVEYAGSGRLIIDKIPNDTPFRREPDFGINRIHLDRNKRLDGEHGSIK